MTCTRLALLLAGIMAVAPFGHAIAQGQRQQSPPPPPTQATPPPEAPPPPYEPQLLELAEIMGSLAYLRTLCGGKEADVWRERMTALIEAEGRTPQRRERLMSAYNGGFRAYSATHRSCSGGSQEAARRLAAEGDRLARSLAGRYGG